MTARHVTATAVEAMATALGSRQLIVVSWNGEELQVESFGQSVEDTTLAAAAAQQFVRTLGWPEAFLAESARRELADLKCDQAAAVAALVAAPAPLHLAKLNTAGVTLARYAEWFDGPRRKALIAAGVLSRPQEGSAS